MPRLFLATTLFTAALVGSAAGHAQPAPLSDTDAARRALLPPELPWRGKSVSLVASPLDPWITPSEASGFERTPSYDDTVAWLKKLVAAAPELQLVSLGRSPEGRDIFMVVASKERAGTPQALAANGKPTLFAQAGIHSGEIDGKDAGLMLLRDLGVRGTRRALLERANLLFVPILSVDAHERSSPYARINQRGPSPSGWRTNARNQNLNRDYGKLDTPEMRAVVRALGEWNPDLYFDLHVTDGMDYQYDVTFGWNGAHGHSPAIAGWLDTTLGPALRRDLEAMGHVPGPLIQPIDNDDPSKGLVEWTADTRFSNGYGDARHLATVLFENHSLKPYRQRVLGTYVALESALRALGEQGAALRTATSQDRARRPSEVTLAWKPTAQPDATLTVRGVRARHEPSPITGADQIVWTGEPETQALPLLRFRQPAATAALAAAYWIPPAWGEVIERLALHGVRMEKQTEAREVDVEMYRVGDFKLDAPFEGHTPVTATVSVERRRERFPPGSVRIPADQPLYELAALLLEPASPDSYFHWGFFLETLQATEYVEGYVMEPMARAMLAADPTLAAEFKQRLAGDKAFAADPRARLQWFYERTPFFDPRYRLYPVGREMAAAGAGLKPAPTTAPARP